MYFRSQRKLQGEVSLSDAIDTDKEGDVAVSAGRGRVPTTPCCRICRIRRSSCCCGGLVQECLTEREADIIRTAVRAGADIRPRPSGRWRRLYGISRSYVSRIEKRALEKLEKELRKG